MTDIVERAKNWAADTKRAHVYGVSVRADLSTIGMVNELVAEVERRRSTLARALVLAEQWEAATTWDGRKSVVRHFGEELRGVITSNQDEVAE